MRALIIENNQAYREMLDHSLAEQGFLTDSGDSVEAARRFVDTETYDLVCVSQDLRDGRGEEIVAYCNSHPRNGQAPILLLTENCELQAEDLEVRVDGVVHELNEQQIEDQIVHFIDQHLDPVFSEGRILFVEDDEAVVNDILSQLENTGYQVTHFRTAEEAAEEFDRVKVYGSHTDAYDLVLTRLIFQGTMSGDELIGRIRAYEDGRGFIPIIVITDIECDDRRISLYRAGVNDFLQKPILQEELLIRINNLITNKRLLDKVHDIRRELFALATIDNLTGCHNRHALMEFSSKFLSTAQRHQYPVAMLVIDLDHFKSINDNHGHAVGDVVLQQTGALLRESFRDDDLVSRYGGEEFVVLMTHCNGENATQKAERVRAEVEKLQPAGIGLTTSIGVTSFEVGCEGDFEDMFRAADEGVYAAKDGGRNRVVYVPMRPAVETRESA